MRTKIILPILILTAMTTTFSCTEAMAGVSVQVGTPNVNFSINDYQPAPPNVYIHNDGGRPYYVERDRRVYMEKKKHGKHHKKEKKHQGNNGHGGDHDKGGRHK